MGRHYLTLEPLCKTGMCGEEEDEGSSVGEGEFWKVWEDVFGKSPWMDEVLPDGWLEGDWIEDITMIDPHEQSNARSLSPLSKSLAEFPQAIAVEISRWDSYDIQSCWEVEQNHGTEITPAHREEGRKSRSSSSSMSLSSSPSSLSSASSSTMPLFTAAGTQKNPSQDEDQDRMIEWMRSENRSETTESKDDHVCVSAEGAEVEQETNQALTPSQDHATGSDPEPNTLTSVPGRQLSPPSIQGQREGQLSDVCARQAAWLHHAGAGQLSKYYHLSRAEAAEQLGVSVTLLKRKCRRVGIRRWPYRKMQAIQRRMEQLMADGEQRAEGKRVGMKMNKAWRHKELENLKHFADLLRQDPDTPLPRAVR